MIARHQVRSAPNYSREYSGRLGGDELTRDGDDPDDQMEDETADRYGPPPAWMALLAVLLFLACVALAGGCLWLLMLFAWAAEGI